MTTRDTPLPDDVRRFITAHALTVPHVEAITLMRANRDAYWDAARLAGRLYVNERIARRVLADLKRIGLTEAGAAGARYRAASDELEAVVALLDQVYATNLVAVTRLIHALHASGVRDFADAFKLRKDPP